MLILQCDVCGSLDEAGETPKIGTSILVVTKTATADNKFARLMGRIRGDQDFFQLCRECTSQFTLLIAARREQRI